MPTGHNVQCHMIFPAHASYNLTDITASKEWEGSLDIVFNYPSISGALPDRQTDILPPHKQGQGCKDLISHLSRLLLSGGVTTCNITQRASGRKSSLLVVCLRLPEALNLQFKPFSCLSWRTSAQTFS